MYKLQYNTASGPVEESFDDLDSAKEQAQYLLNNNTGIDNVEGQELIDFVTEARQKKNAQ